MKAKVAAMMACNSAKVRFPDDADGMAKMEMDFFAMAGVLKYTDSGSHKYIPTEDLNEALGLRQGGGVFGYYKFEDGSYVLMTCSNGLAVWDGTAAGKPEFWKASEPVPPVRKIAQ